MIDEKSLKKRIEILEKAGALLHPSSMPEHQDNLEILRLARLGLRSEQDLDYMTGEWISQKNKANQLRSKLERAKVHAQALAGMKRCSSFWCGCPPFDLSAKQILADLADLEFS